VTRAERFETFDSAQEIDRTEGHQGIIPEITGDHRRESLRALRPGLVLQLLRLDVLLQNDVGTQNSSHELQHELHGHPSHLNLIFLNF